MSTGHAAVWNVYLMSVLLGFVNVVDNPARQTFVLEMVGREDLPNAVSLNSVVMNSSRVVGPAIGGVLIAAFGIAPCFYINAASYVAVIVALSMMDASLLHRMPTVERAKGQLREGLRYAWSEPHGPHPAAHDGGDRHARVQLPGRDPADRDQDVRCAARADSALLLSIDGRGRGARRSVGRVAARRLVPAADHALDDDGRDDPGRRGRADARDRGDRDVRDGRGGVRVHRGRQHDDPAHEPRPRCAAG